MKIIITYLTFLILVSCSQAKKTDELNKKENIITMNQITSNYDSLTNNVKNKGDKDSYNELFYSFMDSNISERTDSLMIYSKIMAQEYNYNKAYFDYFKALCEKNKIYVDFSNYGDIDISKLNDSTKTKAINWLNMMLVNKVISQDDYDKIHK
jgi:hypothetical protein